MRKLRSNISLLLRGELTEAEEVICRDFLRRLEETGQIYIADFDTPISITTGLFELLDKKRKEIAARLGVPETQFDWEDFLWYCLQKV